MVAAASATCLGPEQTTVSRERASWGRSAETSPPPKWMPPIPPVAITPIPTASAANAVADTVVAPSRPRATTYGRSRTVTFQRTAPEARACTSWWSAPTISRPAITPMTAGSASALATAACWASADSRLAGDGRPWASTLDSRATTALALAMRSATTIRLSMSVRSPGWLVGQRSRVLRAAIGGQGSGLKPRRPVGRAGQAPRVATARAARRAPAAAASAGSAPPAGPAGSRPRTRRRPRSRRRRPPPGRDGQRRPLPAQTTTPAAPHLTTATPTLAASHAPAAAGSGRPARAAASSRLASRVPARAAAASTGSPAPPPSSGHEAASTTAGTPARPAAPAAAMAAGRVAGRSSG